MSKQPPIFDDNGINILDQNDTLGYKSTYITLLQEKSIKQYVPAGDGIALDVGCGYGRLSSFLNKLGWSVVGIDPSQSLIDYARQSNSNSGISFIKGELPNLPVEKECADLIIVQNVLRPLKLMGEIEKFKGVSSFLRSDGFLVIVDNIWEGHSDTFLTHEEMMKIGDYEGLELISATPIRTGRWWLLYLIRYGLVPKRFFEWIAGYELNKCKKASLYPKISYMNALYRFKKKPYS